MTQVRFSFRGEFRIYGVCDAPDDIIMWERVLGVQNM